VSNNANNSPIEKEKQMLQVDVMEKFEVTRVVYEEPSTSHRNKINIRIWYDVGDYWKLVCEVQVHLEILMFEGEDGDLTIA
jgi:hypothetical protein